MSEGNIIDLWHLPENFFYLEANIEDSFQKKQSLRHIRNQAESRYIQLCLEKLGGNISKTAKLLQVDRTYLYKKLQNLGIK
jgi:two-component system response regulator HydG